MRLLVSRPSLVHSIATVHFIDDGQVGPEAVARVGLGKLLGLTIWSGEMVANAGACLQGEYKETETEERLLRKIDVGILTFACIS